MHNLLKYLGSYRLDALLTSFFVSLEVAMEILIPLVMINLIDLGLKNANMQALSLYAWQLGGLIVIASIGGLLAGQFSARAATGLAHNLRQAQWQSIEQLSSAQVEHFTSASLITRLTSDVNNVQGAFQTIIALGVRTPVMVVLALIASYQIDRQLANTFLLFMPLIIVGIYLIYRVVDPIFSALRKLQDQLNLQIQENVRAIDVVKAYAAESYAINNFKQVTQQLVAKRLSAIKVEAFFDPLVQLALRGAILLIAWLGAQAVVNHRLSTGELMSIFAYLNQILINLMLMAFVFFSIIFSRSSAKRIHQVLSTTSDLKEDSQSQLKLQDGSIHFKGVSFGYPEQPLLFEDFSLTISSGTTVAIMGQTGSGKSSVVALLGRLYDVHSGSIEVGKHAISSYSLQHLRDSVAVVLQKSQLFSGTIAQNLRIANPQASDDELWQALESAQAAGFVRNLPLGLNHLLEQSASNLSGGQRQRLSIARALLKKAAILVLDDATSALDSRTQGALVQALKQHNAQQTQIIIAGRIDSVRHADHIIILEHGKISAQGTHAQLLKRSSYYQQLYRRQHQEEIDHDQL